MNVVRAQIQTVEEIYRLVWTAVANRQPIEAGYEGRSRLFCPHRLGRNSEGRLRVLCYHSGGDSWSGLQPFGFVGGLAVVLRWRSSAGRGYRRIAGNTAPNHSRPTSCVIDADIDAEDQPEHDPQKGQ